MNMSDVYKKIESLRPEMVSTLGELISYPSCRGEASKGAPFGIAARQCLDRALEICKEIGLETDLCDGYAGSATYGSDPELGILCHLDVVPAGDGWTTDPYLAVVKEGKLYGRGAMDDKGPCVSVIYALKALKELGFAPKKGVRLIMGTDEECGSSDLRYYREHVKLPNWLFTPDASYPLINIEKGHIGAKFSAVCESKKLIELHGGRTINAVPASASAVVSGITVDDLKWAEKKADCTVAFVFEENGENVRISASGVSAHASTPESGDNALTALIKLLSHTDLDQPAKSLICGLAEAFPYGETDGLNAGVKACDEISGALTLVLSILDLEDGKLAGAIDIRFPTCESVASINQKLGGTLRAKGFTPDIGGTEPHCTPSDSEFVKTLLASYEAVTGKKGECLAIGGGTYVHGIQGGVAFGCEIEGEDNRIHGADEFIRVDALVENAKIFAEAIVRICE